MRWHPLCHCASSTAVTRKSFYSAATTTILADVRRRVERQLFAWLIPTLTALVFGGANAAPASHTKARFDIPSLTLTDALDRFGEQSGFQIVYEHSQLDGRTAPQITGEMSAARALTRLLAGSGLQWDQVNDLTVIVRRPSRIAHSNAARASAVSTNASLASEVATLGVIEVTADPRRIVPTHASESTFGFQKPVVETPRSVSFISEETIDLFGLSAVEDLVRVVPGVFTTTRFGIQGAVDVRSVPADTYFRGMKRLSLQGHGRSVLAAMDAIEIVGGPPSPIYGMGKIGGYTNLTPKSGRAQSGSYLIDTIGFTQAVVGEYSRREFSFGMGGPLPLARRFDKEGGYYVYGLFEDSDSYTDGVPIRQDVLQAASSVDDFLGAMRLETGVSYQMSRTAGALTGRFTQELVDTGRYIRGTPLVDLDANASGAIGYLEMQRGSPVNGTLSMGNQPLLQTWAWPRDAHGRPLPLDQFPVVPGIPRQLYDYLQAHPEVDPTGALRAQGVGGPLPLSGSVPIGMALDPRTVGYDALDWHRAAAFEKDLQARFVTVFLDLVNDADPDFTLKNQLFYDRMIQYKNSNQPFVQEQDVYVMEDKFTITRRLEDLPSWLSINALASLNARLTVSEGKSTGNDFSSHRTDAMASTWIDALGGMTPNTTFASPLDNSSLATDGYPWVSIYRSRFSELGAALLFDIELWGRTRLLVGGRIDGSDAENVDRAGSFNATAGTSANPGFYSTADVSAQAWDSGSSWSASLSQRLFENVWPYATAARSSIVLDGNNNALANEAINAGHIGAAELAEIGVKAQLFDDRLFMSVAAYEQSRVGVDADDVSAIVYAYATATQARGWELQLKWVPIRSLLLSFYYLDQTTRFDPNLGSTQLVDARMLGFQDVIDAEGNVIFPAEAFLYGGRARIVLPSGVEQYAKKQGNPERQAAFTMSYQWGNGFGMYFSGNYLSSTCTGRLCVVRLPESEVFSIGAFMDLGSWSVKLDVNNAFNERYFRARTGDTLGNVLAQALPDRRCQLTLKYSF
jgi:outer membrane receptor for monomeric catechols